MNPTDLRGRVAFNPYSMDRKPQTILTVLALFECVCLNFPNSIRCKHVWLLLLVAQEEGCSISELKDRMHPLSMGAAFKLVRELSAQSWRKDNHDPRQPKRFPGLGLVRLVSDHHDERVQRVYLSPKGQRFVETLLRSSERSSTDSSSVQDTHQKELL